MQGTVTKEGTPEKTNRRWRNRDPNPTVQMSLRMHEDVYDRFRQHCTTDRRTNGEMLEIMIDAYKRELKR
jgi:hypothetical protein